MARILVVEDNPVMADAIRDVLEMESYEVSVALDGIEGLQAIPAVRPDLIISDVMMPRMDGFEFYQKVRANTAWVFVPFIFLTAKGQEEDIYLGKRLGADDYLVKPYAPENLIATVSSKLARSRTILQAAHREMEVMKSTISQAADREMEIMKHTITRMLGHELRTPLTWIQGYSELLLSNADSMTAEELHASLQSIQAGSTRLARLMEDAVLVVALDVGQAREEFDLTARVDRDLAIYAQQAVDRLRPQAELRRVRLETDLSDLTCPVLVAPRFITEAIVRIVDNGIKFSRNQADSFVRVTLRQLAAEAEITIADNGVGVPADQLRNIFKPLVQVERSRLEQQGMGLGLTVAHGLVKLHSGRIWAESQVNVGTQVHIALPNANSVTPEIR